MGDNGVYGCCPNGQVCSGDGGSEFIMNAEAQTGTTTATSAQATGSTSEGRNLKAQVLLVLGAGAVSVFALL